MAQRLDVATRKGLFLLERSGPGKAWRIARVSFLGDSVTMSMRDPRDGTMFVALNLGHFGVKVHRSTRRGTNLDRDRNAAIPRAARVGTG